MVDIQAIRLAGFKRCKDIELVTPQLSVVVGGNNSGKSSLLQGIHFAVTVLQSAKSAALSGKSQSTLGFDQFIYKPANDLIALNHQSPITSKVGPDFTFTYKDAGSDELNTFTLKLRRGKNANISTTFDERSAFYARASDRKQPFSVFVPGLAGVPLREEKRTESIITYGIAQGDSNLYLRNVLLGIIQNPDKLTRFHEIVGSIFPGLKISSSFDEHVHLFIEIMVEIDGAKIPLEMVGTGCLQAIQLVAYVTMYNPSLLLLDEPDAHLHPSNQRTLAATLQKITETGDTKIILASHSRHMFDSLTYNDQAQIVWLRQGVKQEESNRTNLSILLDLGALDSFELLQSGKRRVIVLTEDTKVPRLRTLLKANGLSDEDYLIQPFNGVTNIGMAAPVADFFTKQGENTYVLIHRDGDCMSEEEKEWWTGREAKKLPNRTYLFVTPFTDIEHSFCQPAHMAEVYNMSLNEAEELVKRVIDANAPVFTIEYGNKRSELKASTLKAKDDVPKATDLIGQGICFDQVKGKSLFPKLSIELQKIGHNPMHLQERPTAALETPLLKELVSKISEP